VIVLCSVTQQSRGRVKIWLSAAAISVVLTGCSGANSEFESAHELWDSISGLVACTGDDFGVETNEASGDAPAYSALECFDGDIGYGHEIDFSGLVVEDEQTLNEFIEHDGITPDLVGENWLLEISDRETPEVQDWLDAVQDEIGGEVQAANSANAGPDNTSNGSKSEPTNPNGERTQEPSPQQAGSNDSGESGNTAETDPRCAAAASGEDEPGIRYKDFGVSLVPTDTSIPDRRDAYNFPERTYDEDRYLIGWNNPTTSDARPDDLPDPYLAVWGESKATGDCSIVELGAGGRVESIGDDKALTLYVYRPMEELPEDDRVILAFTTPLEGESFTVSQEVWNYEDEEPSSGAAEILKGYLEYEG